MIAARAIASVEVSGGEIVGLSKDGIRAWGHSQVRVTGGTIIGQDQGIDARDTGRVVMTGGAVRSLAGGVVARNRARVTIEGGEPARLSRALMLEADLRLRSSPAHFGHRDQLDRHRDHRDRRVIGAERRLGPRLLLLPCVLPPGWAL